MESIAGYGEKKRSKKKFEDKRRKKRRESYTEKVYNTVRREESNPCYSCGGKGHRSRECPSHSKDKPRAPNSSFSSSSSNGGSRPSQPTPTTPKGSGGKTRSEEHTPERQSLMRHLYACYL